MCLSGVDNAAQPVPFRVAVLAAQLPVVLAGGTVLTTILSLVFVPTSFLVLRRPYLMKYFPDLAEDELKAEPKEQLSAPL